MVSGLSAGLAGLIVAGRLGTGYPNAGDGMELDAIVAVVLGGTPLKGGRVSIVGILSAVLLLGVLNNLLNLLQVPTFTQILDQGADRHRRDPRRPARQTGAAGMTVAEAKPMRLPSLVALDRYAIWIVLVLLVLAAGLVSDAFFKINYLANLLRQATPIGITAVGVTFVMILRGVDLSVGGIVSVSAVELRADDERQAGESCLGACSRPAHRRRGHRLASTACSSRSAACRPSS